MTAVVTQPPTTGRVRPRRTLERARTRAGLIYAAPTAVMVAVFFLVPLGLLVWMSFNHWPLLGASYPNGVENYAVVADPLVRKAAVFTLIYTVITTVVLSLVAFGLALLAQQARRGVGVFRTAFFLPASIGLAGTSLLFFGLLSPQLGPVDAVTRALGLGTVNWLGTPNGALWSTVAMITWRFAGFYMLILLTGLQSIPGEVYEAARVDGAGWWQTMRDVTIPLLKPALALMLVLSVTGSILAFEQFYILTGGGPDNSTITLVIALYRQAFVLFDLGKAAALSMVLLLVLLAVNGLQLFLLRKPAE